MLRVQIMSPNHSNDGYIFICSRATVITENKHGHPSGLKNSAKRPHGRDSKTPHQNTHDRTRFSWLTFECKYLYLHDCFHDWKK